MGWAECHNSTEVQHCVCKSEKCLLCRILLALCARSRLGYIPEALGNLEALQEVKMDLNQLSGESQDAPTETAQRV